MIKYFCDICEKEIDLDKHELRRLFVPTQINGIVLNNELEKMMCAACAQNGTRSLLSFIKKIIKRSKICKR